MSLLLKAKIYLVDVNHTTGQMCPYEVEEVIRKYKLKKIKAIITMYLGGTAENVINFYKLKKKYKCYLIEDSCHAFGSSYLCKNKLLKIGSCNHSDISTFSFHPLKTITTGEGGAVTTNNKNIYLKLLLLRSHSLFKKKKEHYWSYASKGIGYNYRLSDVNCALGISQLKNINKILKKRNEVVKLYKDKLFNLSNYISFPNYSEKAKSCHHLMIILIDFKKIKSNKENFFFFMNKFNIFPQQHYIPVFKVCGMKIAKSNYVNTLKFHKNSVSLPIFYSIKEKQIDKVVKYLKKFINLSLNNEKSF
jgi:dTDP-4-amino-4,6-dideoxygalactose transaminase